MLKRTITYPDYNKMKRTEDFYFNITQAELIEMEYTTTGGFSVMIDKLISAVDLPAIIKIMKELILKAYGEKSPDGRRFIKSPELSEAFSQTEAYSQLFMELATNSQAASDFINGILPTPNPQQQAEIKAVLEAKGLPGRSNT
ncbi:MAG: hypothetical protein Q4F83_02825 [Eubacteriales bacterium]|nr:hypothetical protein [Eubacteriales bacterium]